MQALPRREGRLSVLAVLARLCSLALLAAAGCSGGPAPVAAPSYRPEESARLALQEYDANKDGKLDEGELARCPALLGSLKEIDQNGDGALSEDEIAERFRRYQQLGAGRVSVRCRVERNGATTANIVVKLVPEKFMAGAVEGVSGTSDENGNVLFKTAETDISGAPYGFYQVEAAEPGGAPAPLAPDSMRGYEVGPPARGERPGLVIQLAS